MHKDRIRKLADVVEKCESKAISHISDHSDERYFNMAALTFECGSPACIAGWARHLFGDSDEYWAYEILGLRKGDAQRLFAPNLYYADYNAGPSDPGFITGSHAAAVLRNLAETDNVDWKVGADNA